MTDRWQQVVRSLRQRFDTDADLDEVVAFLTAEGYDGGQIGEIVAYWAVAIAGSTGVTRSLVPAGRMPAPVRVLGPHEWGRFAPEAWGRLVALQASGVLSIVDLERLIEHALEQGQGRVALPELRAILDGIGLGSIEPGAGTDPVTIH